MHDPYTPTRYASDATRTDAPESSTHVMQWRRILLGGVLLFVVLTSWSFVSSMLTSILSLWLDPDRAWLASTRIIRKSLYCLFAAAAYWWFSAGVRHQRLLHALLACAWVHAIGAGILLLLLDVHLDYETWDFWVLALLPALLGWTLTLLWPGRHASSPRRGR